MDYHLNSGIPAVEARVPTIELRPLKVIPEAIHNGSCFLYDHICLYCTSKEGKIVRRMGGKLQSDVERSGGPRNTKKLVVSTYLITPGYFLIGNKEALQKDPTRRQRQAARRRKSQAELASPNRPSPRRHHHPYN